MLGAIIGDIIGSRWEFNPTNDYHFELFSDKNGFTDDTICTIALADAILHDSDDYGKYIHEWCRRYPHPMGGYGGRFAQWVRSDNPQPYGSYGNGSAMRVSPVAWAAIDFEFKYLLKEAEKSAACTHNHPEGIKGAQTVALAIQYGIELPCFHPNFTQEHVKELAESCAKFGGYNINIKKEDVINRFDETCQGTVPVALWMISESTSFEDAVRKAVSLGADADTLGAIVGSIAEAIWGIPEKMQLKALEYLPNAMKSVVLRFYDRFIRNSILRGYGDEGTARDLLLEEEEEEMNRQTVDDDEKKQFLSIMLWKLGLGNMSKFFNNENPMPDKTKVAKYTSWKTERMPRTDISKVNVDIILSEEDMGIIRKGHIPEAMEDHWFMFCDDEYIRYYRSWTGMCAFEAHYHKKFDHYIVDELCINQALAEFGVNGDKSGEALFTYLLTAEIGDDATRAWEAYLKIWDETNQKYTPKEKEEKKDLKHQPKDDEFDEQFLESKEEERLSIYRENKEKEEKAKQNGTYARELIKDFIREKLDADISKLPSFDFGTLREDEKYGDCKGFPFSVDKCNIVKAIMSVAFADVWPELNLYNIERYKYLCNGINYAQYLFGANIMGKFFKGMEKFNPTKEQHERAVRVYHLTNCIGNIWVLPGGIDKDKDTYHYHGYADLFLKGIYAAMTSKGKVQQDLKAALYKARKLMAKYKGADGFRQFALDMLLNDYIDYYGKPIDLFMHVWSMMKDLKPETYFKAVDEYCDFMEQFIPKRGQMIVEKLKKVL